MVFFDPLRLDFPASKLYFCPNNNPKGNIMKKLTILLLLLCATLSVGAQAVFEPVELTIDSPSGLYSAGEQVTVYGQLRKECTTPLDLSVMVNGTTIATQQNIALTTEARTPIWTGSFDEASSVILSVGPQGDHKNLTTIGFVVAAEQFTPSFNKPRDLEKFWRKQIRRMRRSSTEITLVSVDVPQKWADKYVCYDLEISMPEGAPVRGYIAYPREAADRSLPITIFAHAAGVRKAHCQSTPERALQWASRGSGAIALDVNAHGYLNGQPQSYYDGLEEGALKDYSKWPLTDHQSFYFRTMFLRLVRALDYATRSSMWDGERVLIYGESQGGAQAAALAGIDKRVTMAVLNVPAMTDLGCVVAGHSAGWPRTYSQGAATEPTAALYQKLLPYYDAAQLLGLTKAKLVVEVGLIDRTCPPEGVCATFNNSPSTDKTLLSFPYRPHTSVNARYRKEWRERVEDVRNSIIDAYLQ